MRLLPDSPLVRVTAFLAFAAAVGVLLLTADYLRTNRPSRGNGRTVDRIRVRGSGVTDEEGEV